MEPFYHLLTLVTNLQCLKRTTSPPHVCTQRTLQRHQSVSHNTIHNHSHTKPHTGPLYAHQGGARRDWEVGGGYPVMILLGLSTVSLSCPWMYKEEHNWDTKLKNRGVARESKCIGNNSTEKRDVFEDLVCVMKDWKHKTIHWSINRILRHCVYDLRCSLNYFWPISRQHEVPFYNCPCLTTYAFSGTILR